MELYLKKHFCGVKKSENFRFYGDNLRITGAADIELGLQIDHKHTYVQLTGPIIKNMASMRSRKAVSDKFNLHRHCTRVKSPEQQNRTTIIGLLK